MFTFDWSNKELSKEEKALLNGFIHQHEIDENIWDIFGCLLRSDSKSTSPLVIRVYKGSSLAGAVFIVKCRKYGKSLFKNCFLSKTMDFIGIPCYVWIKSGLCAEVLANPGFATEIDEEDAIITALLDHIHKLSPFFMVVDRDYNQHLHSKALCYPYMNEGVIETASLLSFEDYINKHKNLRRKIKEFKSMGGKIEVLHGPVGEENLHYAKRCQESIVSRSAIYAPFQDIYIKCVEETCSAEIPGILHFIARAENQFLGYHSFIQTGSGLYLMHGAFDRERETNFRAYENIIIEAVNYAINNNLKEIQMGPVLNETKRRMISKRISNNCYFYSNNYLLGKIISLIFRHSRMQKEELLLFGR